MIVYRCDLCGEVRDCAQREIEQTEYDICSECWNGLMNKLKDKGRPRKQAPPMVGLPPTIVHDTPPEPRHRFPGEPPEIFAQPERTH